MMTAAATVAQPVGHVLAAFGRLLSIVHALIG
jgi:hypothetical protein